MGKSLVAFDLYGTLLSTESIAKELASHFGQERAQSVAAVWRKYQLEYTWRLVSMGSYLIASVLEHADTTKDSTSPFPTSLATLCSMLWQSISLAWTTKTSRA